MEGTLDDRGVNYSTLEEIFQISEERSDTMQLEIKQSAKGTQEVPGLVEPSVHNTVEVWEQQLQTGSRNRAVGSTSSERVGRTEVEGERLKESQFSNKSLSALGDVIFALASKHPPFPYRNSKLTHLLHSSLDSGETLCSLNFASRVRGIEHCPAHKQSDPTEIFKCKQMAEKLKQDEKETKKLPDSLQSLQSRFAASEQFCRSLQDKLRESENRRRDENQTPTGSSRCCCIFN
ncbi:hypothetical protein C5167_026467 [Papaver somniferum]|nr:hypothetical protein C5167_026467 [Papaver somniferum]